jgi:hypothetical protein
MTPSRCIPNFWGVSFRKRCTISDLSYIDASLVLKPSRRIRIISKDHIKKIESIFILLLQKTSPYTE